MSNNKPAPTLDLPPVLPPGTRPACMADPDLWFPDKHTPREDRRLAQRICNRCEFKTQCLTAGREAGEKYGVWGGETQRQRALNRRPQNTS